MKKARLALLCSALMIIGGLGLTACGGSSSSDEPVIQSGTLYFSQDGNGNGLYVVDTATGAATLSCAGTTGVTSSTIGLTGDNTGTTLYGTLPSNINTIAADGSGSTQLHGGLTLEGLAFHSGEQLFYGMINGAFSSVDFATGNQTALTSPAGNPDLEGLACDVTRNRIYAIGNTNTLYFYDTVAATWTTVGDTGMNWDNGGLAYDPVSGWLYAVGQGGGDNLYRINPATAAASLIGPMGLGSAARGGLGITAPVQVSP